MIEMREKISILLMHQLLGTLSTEGSQELQAWLDAAHANKATAIEITRQPLLPLLEHDRRWDSGPALSKVRAFISQQKRIISIRRFSIAAALLVGISGAILTVQDTEQVPVVQRTPLNTDSLATPSIAEMTLSGGAKVLLDTVQATTLMEENDLVVRIDSNNILYSHNNKKKHQHTQPVYNTLALPYHSKAWKITLPSGTTMYIDGGSTISYPITSDQEVTKISLHGLGFFDVATEYKGVNKKKFIVSANGVETEVTGTRFIIQSFPEDSTVRTTLLSGNVIVTDKKRRVLLKPAQEATFNTVNGGVKYENVDTTNTLRFLEGVIDFGNSSSTISLKRIAKAFGIEITYKNQAVYSQMLDFVLIGSMSIDRDISIDQLAKLLENRFKIKVKVKNGGAVIEVLSLEWDKPR